VSEAEDRSALQHLVTLYCHAVDRRDYGLLRSLYHDDAIDDHGAMFCGSPDDYVAWLPGMMAHWQATRHSLTNMLFLLDGDAAEGELVTDAWHRTLDGTRDIIAHGRYLDRYQRRDGAWKFWRRSLVLDWMEERAVTEASGPDDGVAKGCAGADDPCFARLPLFRAHRAS
jgi:hypothetical protein